MDDDVPAYDQSPAIMRSLEALDGFVEVVMLKDNTSGRTKVDSVLDYEGSPPVQRKEDEQVEKKRYEKCSSPKPKEKKSGKLRGIVLRVTGSPAQE